MINRTTGFGFDIYDIMLMDAGIKNVKDLMQSLTLTVKYIQKS